MHRSLTTLATLFIAGSAFLAIRTNAQSGPPPPPDSAKLNAAGERMPGFIGNLSEYLAANIHYPDSARVHGQEGRVVLRFLVNKRGMLQDLKIVRSSGFPLLDAEALRVIQPMQFLQRWSPGMMHGEPVDVYFSLPVSFHL